MTSFRSIEVVAYPESSRIEDIKKSLDEWQAVDKYAYILHNQDGKKEHYHIALKFNSPTNTNVLKSKLGVSDNQISKIKGRWSDILQYLTHANAKEKHQYSTDEIISNFDVQQDIKSEDNKLQIICNKILMGEISPLQAYSLLGDKYDSRATKFIKDAFYQYCIRMEVDREVEVLFIYGKAGTGKTRLAKLMSQTAKLDMCVSSSSNDPLQDYMGQKVLLLDDVREDTFTLTDWLKMLDNNTNSSVKSRYNNKVFTGELIIITSSVSPVTWFRGTSEQRWQFFRRVNYVTHLTDDGYMEQYRGFMQAIDGYITLGEMMTKDRNPISVLQEMDKPKQKLTMKVMAAAVDYVKEIAIKNIGGDKELKPISEQELDKILGDKKDE